MKRAKIDADAVRSIRAKLDPIQAQRKRLDAAERLALAGFAVEYRMHVRTIRKIANRERWKDLDA